MSLTRRQLMAGAGAVALVIGLSAIAIPAIEQEIHDLKSRIWARFPNAASVHVGERDYGFVILATVTWEDGGVTNATAEAAMREGKTAGDRIFETLDQWQPMRDDHSRHGIVICDDIEVDGLRQHSVRAKDRHA